MSKDRNALILRAIVDKLGSGIEIYTAEDILLAANIESENLQEVQERLTNSVDEIVKRKEEKHWVGKMQEKILDYDELLKEWHKSN